MTGPPNWKRHWASKFPSALNMPSSTLFPTSTKPTVHILHGYAIRKRPEATTTAMRRKKKGDQQPKIIEKKKEKKY